MTGPKKVSFQRVTPRRVIDEIAQQIKEMIFSGSLKPDDRLPSEKELAASLGTGRMTVREALRMLEAIGFIYIKQGAEGGAFVKELDESALTSSIAGLLAVGNVTLAEITEARIAVECLLLESAIVKADAAQLEALEDNITHCKTTKSELGEGMPPSGLVDFHILLAAPSGNQLLKYFLRSLIDLSNHYILRNLPALLPLSPTHIKEHEQVLHAFRQRQLNQARDALKKHLIASAQQIDQAKETHRSKPA